MDSADVEQHRKVKVGDVVTASPARNWKFHKKAFALLNIGYKNQEKYANFEIYRKVVTIKAGYFEWVEGKDGTPHPMPESLSYKEMSAERFEKWYNDTLEVIGEDLKMAPAEVKAELAEFQ